MEVNVASSKREVSRAADQIVAKARELERENIEQAPFERAEF